MRFLKALCLTLLYLIPFAAFAVTEEGTRTSADEGFGTTLALSHTIPSGATAVVVIVSGEDWGNGDPTPGTADIDSDLDAFTSITRIFSGGLWAEALILSENDVDWPASLPASVTLTYNTDGSSAAIRGTALNYSDTVAARASVTNNGTGTDVGLNSLSSSADDVILAVLSSGGNASISYDASAEGGFEEIRRETASFDGSGNDVALWTEEGATTSKDVGATFGASTTWVGLAFSLEHGAGGAGGATIPITLQQLDKAYGPQLSQQLGGLLQ